MPSCARQPIGRILAVLAAVACCAAPAGASAAKRHHTVMAARACANADTPATAASTDAMRSAVVCLINQQRAGFGLPAVRESSLLNRSAQRWTNVMVATQSFWHGVHFASRITAVGFSWLDAGENIATGFPTPAAVVTAWMASKDHCVNILDPHYDRIGTGLSRHPVNGFASGPSTWTQDFALPMSGRAPSRNTAPQQGCPY
jgi:uncharacterized protein YkwD